MNTEMVDILDSTMTVIRTRRFIGFDFDMTWGGGTEVIELGCNVEITTKFGKEITGLLRDFKESDVEGKQDYIVVESPSGMVEVGIHDIKTLRCDDDARVV